MKPLRIASACALLAALLVLLLAACRPGALVAQAPRLEDVGNASFAIATRVPLAQVYFDQGLRLAQAFDHAEALRAFAEAARLDPECAMCAWGIAYAAGSNINHPQRPADPRAVAAVQRALQLAAKAGDKERALIGALAWRYDGAAAVAPVQEAAVCSRLPLPRDADRLDLAYAEAMAAVARRFPEDDEIALLYAESLLMLAPWDWWDGDAPREGTLAAIDVLERVLARSPSHAGANHYLIHAFERSPTPQRALDAAGRLAQLAPDAGHLVHMASHIFVRVGRYADAVRANQQAIEADRRLEAQLRAQGYAPLGRVSHHHHFLWAAASMRGDAAVALEAARWLAAEAARPERPFGADGSNDYFLGLHWLALVRFARWDEIVAAPPPQGSTYATANWRYARGVALARSGKPQHAAKELAALQLAAADPALAALTLKGTDDLTALALLAVESLRGEIALAQRRYARAIEHLRRAVELEDALQGEEPPPWPLPARQALGAALLLAGKPREAEQAFRTDLDRHPESGWALHGLAESLRRQRRSAEAAAVAARFAAAWPPAATPPDRRSLYQRY